MQGVSERALQFIPTVTVANVMKTLHLKAYKLSIVQSVEKWIFCMPYVA
jgi:hypothetical protein